MQRNYISITEFFKATDDMHFNNTSFNQVLEDLYIPVAPFTNMV